MKHIFCKDLTVTASEITAEASWFQTFPPYGRYAAAGAGGLDKKAKKVSLGTGYNGEKTSFSSSIFSDHASKHFKDNESNGNNVPMEEGDYELLPTLWRSPDRHSVDEKRKAETFELDLVDGNVLTMIYRKGHGPVTVYKKAARSTVERMHASPHDGASTTV